MRPQTAGADGLETELAVYVFDHRSLADLLVTDIVCERSGLTRPVAALEAHGVRERRRFFSLNHASGALWRRNTMRSYSERMVRLKDAALADPDLPIVFVPVSVFWGRAPSKERSVWRMVFSESWEVTSSFKRLVGLIVNRTRILVHFGHPIRVSELVAQLEDENRATRRIARVLRVALRNQRVATLGPDFSHLRTLVRQIANSRRVSAVINSTAQTEKARHKLRQRALRHAEAIASNMSYTAIRSIERLLTWFWNRIYRGVDVNGVETLTELAETHTLVLTPSHRSHIDYLLLSYLMFNHGLMIPHIAAGDNLNLPVLGGILRRGGAFFMRRSFRDDRLYYAVFSEYLYQVYRRGHSVEFFIEGGRSRTGRLLPAKTGLLQMTIEHHLRGVPRPIAMVPVYFGYEKVIEANSYLDELKGADKKRESLSDLVGGLRLIRRDFGRVSVNFGEPVLLGEFVAAHPGSAKSQAQTLGDELLVRINAAANVNPVNLICMILLGMPRLAMDEMMLVEQLTCYLALLKESGHPLPQVSSPKEIITHAERLEYLEREGAAGGAILSLSPRTAVLGTWYRNNTVHTLVQPALLAALVADRRRPIAVDAIDEIATLIYPYLQNELHSRRELDTQHWLDKLLEINLLEVTDEGLIRAPAPNSPERYRLSTLAQLVMPTLERFYIVIGLLIFNPEPATRKDLSATCQALARRMARLYGLNAPEFFDARLFHQFIDLLVSRDAVYQNAAGFLQARPVVDRVVRAADRVISAEFRQAVARATAGGVAS